jgi:DNA-directed RNA polymerase specialized sigma24 family protein
VRSQRHVWKLSLFAAFPAFWEREAETMRDDPSVVALVPRAESGDRLAWNDIVQRYDPLVWSICRRHGITGADADDVDGTVRMQPRGEPGKLREPAALPGWLATTTRRECLALLRNQNREAPHHDWEPVDHAEPAPDTRLLTEERQIAIRDATVTLQRCLARLRRSPTVSTVAHDRKDDDMTFEVSNAAPNTPTPPTGTTKLLTRASQSLEAQANDRVFPYPTSGVLCRSG